MWKSFRRGLRPLVTRLFPILLVVLFAPVSAAQTTTGTIVGNVTDASGGVLPGATVTITHVDTGISRTGESGADGTFLVPALPSGLYKVTVTLEGFKSFTQDGVTLEVGQNARVDARLELGTVTEQVAVTGDALLVNTQSSSVGVVVDQQRLAKLPLNGRGVLSLALLVPGVGAATLPTVVTDQRAGPTISVSGSRTNQNNVMLDGAQLATSLRNVAQNLPSPDSLQEFQVLTNTYSAEYGRASGGTLMAITKSGTNEVQGVVWEYVRNDALNARNAFAPSKPFLRQNQFGGSAGGPIVRNRTFVFGSYEGIRIRQEAILRFFPPSQAQRSGDFSDLSTSIIDPLTGQPFPGNRIPAERLDPMALNILDEYIPLPNDGRESNTLGSRPTDGDQFTVKGDHKFGADHLSVRFYRNTTTGLQGGGNINSLASERGNVIQGTTFSDTHIFPGQ
jgi:Carboxypeptidase regulatory-like domain/TonB-dependent Receptor Plug Domain